jgi:hypothetical protein
MAGGRGDHGHATVGEISHDRRQAVELALQPLVLDHHVLAFDVAGFVEALTECSVQVRGGLARPAIETKPTTGNTACCARAASGHAAAPPKSVMKSRRFS